MCLLVPRRKRSCGESFLRNGVSASRRNGVLARWPTLSQRGPYDPSVGLVDHSNDLRYDFVARVVERFEGLPIDVVVVKSNVEMHLCFARLRLCIVKL
jgi:hypothetical protein